MDAAAQQRQGESGGSCERPRSCRLSSSSSVKRVRGLGEVAERGCDDGRHGSMRNGEREGGRKNVEQGRNEGRSRRREGAKRVKKGRKCRQKEESRDNAREESNVNRNKKRTKEHMHGEGERKKEE